MKIAFNDPEHNWVCMTLLSANERFDFILSGAAGNGFVSLIDVLRAQTEGDGRSSFEWLSEPDWYEFTFTKRNDACALIISWWPGTRRLAESKEHLFSVEGTFDEVYTPFWRALRSLQGRFTEQELQERWNGGLPTRQLDDLTAALQARRKSI